MRLATEALLYTINLQVVLLGDLSRRTGGGAGVGSGVGSVSTGDLQLPASRQNPDSLVCLQAGA